MNKLKLLQEYKRANKERRKKILIREGYSTEELYLTALGTIHRAMGLKVKKSTEQVSDMVIAFDSTGSMSSYIQDVKSHVISLIPKLFEENKNLRLKIVVFGDYCDMVNSTTFGKAYQESQLTNNTKSLINFVKEAQNTSGGDGDEFYELVIQKINTETPWRTNSKKSVLLIADCAPHKVGYTYRDFVVKNQIDWRAEAKNAKTLGIKYDTLAISEYEPWFKELSTITGGIYLPFKSSNKTSQMLDGYVTARSSGTSSASYMSKTAAVLDSGDTELIGLYKKLSTLD